MKLPDFGKYPGLIRLKEQMGIETDHPDASWRDDFCMKHGEGLPCMECRIIAASCIEAEDGWPV